MTDKLLQVGNIFGPKVAIKSRGVRVLKKNSPAFDAADMLRRHEIALLRLLAARHPRIVRELANEKSFDSETG